MANYNLPPVGKVPPLVNGKRVVHTIGGFEADDHGKRYKVLLEDATTAEIDEGDYTDPTQPVKEVKYAPAKEKTAAQLAACQDPKKSGKVK